MSKPEKMKLSRQFRYSQIAPVQTAAGVDEYELTFSDETPVMRFFGKEILLHGSKNVDLERLNAGAPLLFNHDANKPIGVVIPGSAKVANKRGHARVKFLPTQAG